MKTIAKDNTKLIRKENTKGNFSTIKNSIKYDLRLSPTSRLILLEVFSNSDDFAYSETYILKFLGMTKQTYYKYRDELIKFGYLKIKSNVKNPNLNYYIFSEFGNLKTEEETVQPKAKPELCDIDDIEKFGYDKIIDSIVTDLTNKDYDVNIEKIFDMFLTKVTKEQLEKGIEKSKLEKSIIQKCSTKTEVEKISEEEIKQMVSTRVGSLTIKDRETVVNKILNRYKENPSMTKEKIGSTISSFVSTIKNNKLQSQDQYYQN